MKCLWYQYKLRTFFLFLKDETQEIRKSERARSADQHYGNAVNIPEEPFDPDFHVSTWDDSILGE